MLTESQIVDVPGIRKRTDGDRLGARGVSSSVSVRAPPLAIALNWKMTANGRLSSGCHQSGEGHLASNARLVGVKVTDRPGDDKPQVRSRMATI